MNNSESYNNPHCSFVNWIISVRNIPYAKSLWVVADVVVDVLVSVVGVNLELEKEIVNWVGLRKSH